MLPPYMLPPYILITSVKDELPHLRTVVDSLSAQNPLPLRWYITDDGSTDGSLDVLREAAKNFPFITLIEKPSRPKGERSWGVQYTNMNKMYFLADREFGKGFAYIGVHDADVAVDPDFYFRLLTEALRDPALGMIGGVIYQPRSGEWKPRSENASDSVPGSVLISRKCFDAVGGYEPKELGETDWLFQTDAMRFGFKVKVVPEAILREYRKTANTTMKGSFKAGKMDASLGSDFLFEIAKCARRALHSPFGINGFLRLAGYLYYRATRKPSVGPERYEFLRSMQRAKLLGKRA